MVNPFRAIEFFIDVFAISGLFLLWLNFKDVIKEMYQIADEESYFFLNDDCFKVLQHIHGPPPYSEVDIN